MSLRPTVRLKLTLLYGGLFLLAGTVLLAFNYALVSRGLHAQSGPERARIGVVLRATEPFQIPVTGPGGSPETLVGPDGRPLEDVLRDYEAGVRDDTLHALLVQSSIALGVMAVAAVGLGWLVAGRALRPLQQVTAAAQRLSEANLHERLALQGPKDELKELADTFDAMLERLEKAFESQRRFVANASHELRTPLTIQRTLVEVTLADPEADERALREMAVSLEAAISRSQRLLDSLLLLARSEQRLTRAEPVDLADAAALAVEHMAGEAAANGISVATELRPALVAGNPALLERLVANLVENGVRHNRSEGWLKVETDAHDGTATLRITNSGAVVPPIEVPGLFEPFRRLHHDRAGSEKGTGLGLSIVRAVALAHGGRVRAVGREAGGLEVTVTVPVEGPVRGRAPGEQRLPWPDVSAAPTAPRPASAGSGEDAASPTSTPPALGSPIPTSSTASGPS